MKRDNLHCETNWVNGKC